MTRLPTFFLSHGGGPWPFMEDRRMQYAKTAAEFARLPQLLPAPPKAVLVITGHWEAEAFTVSSSAHPPMVYDYYGFPEHTYHLKYPAPGKPELAVECRRCWRAPASTAGRMPIRVLITAPSCRSA